jgi:hypothetical protein
VVHFTLVAVAVVMVVIVPHLMVLVVPVAVELEAVGYHQEHLYLLQQMVWQILVVVEAVEIEGPLAQVQYVMAQQVVPVLSSLPILHKYSKNIQWA